LSTVGGEEGGEETVNEELAEIRGLEEKPYRVEAYQKVTY
jgi:hypothetical protein